jgi:hypothetical protein
MNEAVRLQSDVPGAVEKVGLSFLSVEHGGGADDHEAAVTQT